MTAIPTQGPAAPETPSIIGLGHVGIHVHDLEASRHFWCDLLGFQVTDGSVVDGMLFLSTDPANEHHMLLLREGRTVEADGVLLQQISFICRDLETVIELSHVLRAAGTPTMDVTHGNAVGAYFRDPDGNRCEFYWKTGLEARQVFVKGINLDRTATEVLEQVRQDVATFGESGFREQVPFTLEYPSV